MMHPTLQTSSLQFRERSPGFADAPFSLTPRTSLGRDYAAGQAPSARGSMGRSDAAARASSKALLPGTYDLLAEAATEAPMPPHSQQRQQHATGRPESASGRRPQSGIARSSDLIGGWGARTETAAAAAAAAALELAESMSGGRLQSGSAASRQQQLAVSVAAASRPISGVSRPSSARSEVEGGRPASARPGSARGGMPQPSSTTYASSGRWAKYALWCTNSGVQSL